MILVPFEGEGCRAGVTPRAISATRPSCRGRMTAGRDSGRGVRTTSHPVAIGGCFAWLHQATSRTTGRTANVNTAVLLCPALGWDGLHAHHGFRLLAGQFAAAGYPALRMQYLGTGDSADLPENGSATPWETWRQCVNQAADWLRDITRAQRILLVGLRFGATLALAVAEGRADVAGVALLAPVLRGKSYMRQLDMEARLEGGGLGPCEAGGLDLHELQFSQQAVAQLSALDMRAVAVPPGLQIAVAAQAPSKIVDTCTQAWTHAGAHVDSLSFTGLEPLLQEAIHSDPPEPDFTELLEWAERAVPSGASVPATGRLAAPLREPAFDHGTCIETPVQFGANRSLSGVLCRPASGSGRLAIIITNTGRDPRYGIGRFGVQVARRLANEGIASLRIDFAGLGDSPAPAQHGDRLSSLFETDRTGDIGGAIDMLQGLGFQEFALQGLCSGAYHAFRAAQHDTRVGALLLINLPVFEWHGGESVKAAIWATAPANRLLTRLFDRAAWNRVLQGHADLRSFLQAQRRRYREAALCLMGPLAPARPYPARALDALAQRQVRTLLLYSAGDPGLDVFEAAFGRLSEQPAECRGASVHVVQGIDHVLSGRHMRETVINLIVAFVAENERRSAAHDRPIDHPGSNDHDRPLAEADARAVA